ncbi:MAG: leucine--tRNA ligase [archaeon]
MEYNHSEIEAKWQKRWLESGAWKTKKSDSPKFFMHFAYPGVSGYQHIGHMRGFSYTDAICRYKRMTGCNVFFPVGVHASGNQAIGFAKKVERKDPQWIDYLKANGYPESELDKMKDADYVVAYFVNNYCENWKKYGFLADWDSLTCTVYPDYSRFIEWQFRKLDRKKLLVREPYMATFCPNDGPVAVDPSETDISKGGNAEKHEYTLLKFKIGNGFIVAATLRPETVFGQTNLWVDPDEEYAQISVNGETWVCSKQCASKLANQKDGVEILPETVKGSEMIGKHAVAPGVEREIIILPSSFTDPNVGTGIVTSVPSDAPYDYMALKDLQNDEFTMKKHGLDFNAIRTIKPIPIINSKDYGDTPAVKICEEMQIKNQNDPKLEEATKIIYKTGFHTGVLNNNCGEFAGMSVEQAKDKMKEKLISEGKADVMYDLSEEVVCRCGERVFIKKIPDQWFIKYSDRLLKEESKRHAEQMNIMPREYAENISSVLDWFGNRACARLGNWLGTKLPFDERWTIEPISDSTLYPAYYVVSRYFNAGKISLEEMNEDFFDYVFLGEGAPKNETWKEIRDEFDYWYPVDINLGGKEHKTVHFPVYIMNHVAIMREKDWPRGIFVNYWVTGKGGKISKSKGGASFSPAEAARMFSADGVRLYYAHSASPFADVEWNEDAVFSYKKHVESMVAVSEKLSSMTSSSENHINKWILSKAHSKLKQYHAAMEEYDMRKAAGLIIFDFMKDINRFIARGGNDALTAREVQKILLTAMTPFTPHACEECWEKAGNKTLISLEAMPSPDESKICKAAELAEDAVINAEADISNVIKLANIKPKKITLFVAGEWKRKAWEKAKSIDAKEIVNTLMSDPKMKEYGVGAVKYAQWLQKHSRELGEIIASEEEMNAFESATGYLARTFGAEIIVVNADESDHAKAANAIPGKPAILVE